MLTYLLGSDDLIQINPIDVTLPVLYLLNCINTSRGMIQSSVKFMIVVKKT